MIVPSERKERKESILSFFLSSLLHWSMMPARELIEQLFLAFSLKLLELPIWRAPHRTGCASTAKSAGHSAIS